MKALGSRLERLEQKVDIKAALARQEEARRRYQAERAILQQFAEVLDLAWPLLSEAHQAQLEPPDDRTRKWPLDQWLRSLKDGSSKLPDLDAQTVQRLLLSWCDPHLY